MNNNLKNNQSKYIELVERIATKYINDWVDEDTTNISEDEVSAYVEDCYLQEMNAEEEAEYYAMRDSCYNPNMLGGGTYEFKMNLCIDVYENLINKI